MTLTRLGLAEGSIAHRNTTCFIRLGGSAGCNARSGAAGGAGFNSTASCESRITWISGKKGKLQYRGYPIEQLADPNEGGDFVQARTCPPGGLPPRRSGPRSNHNQLPDVDLRHFQLCHSRLVVARSWLYTS